jgi:putative PEP-CTERM system histidine kinase
VTNPAFVTAAAWSYGLVAAGYLSFAVWVAVASRRKLRANLLLAALLLTAVWGALCLPLAFGATAVAIVAEDVANALRYAAWFAFVGHLLLRPGEAEAHEPVPRRLLFVVALAFVADIALGDGLRVKEMLGFGIRAGFALQLTLVVFGLVLVEQLIRRVQPQHRWGIKPLAVALACIFGFELFLYADALLFGHLDADIWVARGFANVLLIPFIAIATARNTGWTIDLHVSRKAVFHSSALLISGGFLLIVAGAGYFVRYFGGDWGRALEIELLFAAAVLVVLVVSSGSFRARLKVFVSKHFFSYRYDYREEWLRFTRTLSTESPLHSVQQRTIVALADLVESPAGVLCLLNEASTYALAARWNVPAVDATEPLDGSLSGFLHRTGWIVSVSEVRSQPDRYAGLTLPAWLVEFPAPWLIVPLASGDTLLGFVVLAAPRTPVDVDWEVRDLLKTASRQAASYLGEIRASEALLEARKFDAFNRMSAFVVHDLKNLIAQLSLMLRNAQRHRDNPQFQADMLTTVEHVVERMNALMLQLRVGSEPVESPRQVDVEALVRRVCASKAHSSTRLVFECCARGATMGHEDRLEHVIGHLVQNAIDASPPHETVAVGVESEDRFIVVTIVDRGVGMAPDFVRERLFKPFQTTKVTGMGIGVYESGQYVGRIGGEILVDSALGEGTRVRVRLPRADPALPTGDAAVEKEGAA